MKNKDELSFINRELSWLEFNHRVLDCAEDRAMPLLERVKFLSISGSNLDEFFMVRVGELRMLAEEGIDKKDSCGMTAREQLDALAYKAHAFADRQALCCETLFGLLARQGIRRLRPADLSPEQVRHAERTFTNEIFPVLSPIAAPSTLKFPLLAGATLHIAVLRGGKTAR
ncbi:MAG TPA: hypothetical protein VF335_05395, partial [Chitinivibrionales bacterium]